MEKSCLLWKRKSYEKPGMSTKLQNVGEGGGEENAKERREKREIKGTVGGERERKAKKNSSGIMPIEGETRETRRGEKTSTVREKHGRKAKKTGSRRRASATVTGPRKSWGNARRSSSIKPTTAITHLVMHVMTHSTHYSSTSVADLLPFNGNLSKGGPSCDSQYRRYALRSRCLIGFSVKHG